MKTSVLLLAALLASGAGAKTVYVNCNFDDYTGHDGSTPELALKTLLEATGYKSSNPYAADDGDTVTVGETVTEYTADTTIELGADEISSATFAYAGTGAAEIGSFKSNSGFLMLLR